MAVKAISEEDVARLELELIKDSKEIDLFDFKNNIGIILAIMALLFPIFFQLSSAVIQKNNGLIWAEAFWIFFVLVILLLAILLLLPIQKSFKRKHYLARQRYKVLGIDPLSLDAQLKEIP